MHTIPAIGRISVHENFIIFIKFQFNYHKDIFEDSHIFIIDFDVIISEYMLYYLNWNETEIFIDIKIDELQDDHLHSVIDDKSGKENGRREKKKKKKNTIRTLECKRGAADGGGSPSPTLTSTTETTTETTTHLPTRASSLFPFSCLVSF